MVSLVARPSADPALADVLRTERERQQRSQESLAHDAGLTTIAIGNIERADSDPHWSTVRRVVDALGLSQAEFGRRLDEHAPHASKRRPS